MSNDDSISLNKFISSTGMCSRREADRYIEQGLVKINGRIAKKGNRVYPKDEVLFKGKKIKNKDRSARVYLAYHKPYGITCTTDQRDPSNIISAVGYKERIFPVGRLDKASTGLILLTNDGDIVNKILRKENDNQKEYVVKVNIPITSQFLHGMANGVPILGTKTQKCRVQKIGNYKFSIILTQGLNRQIRRMCEFYGYQVVSLKRIRIMHILLGNLAMGQWRYLKSNELNLLLQ